MRRLDLGTTLLLLALLFGGGGWIYRHTQQRSLEETKAQALQTAAEIQEAQAFKKIWNPKGIGQKLEQIKRTIPTGQIKTFRRQRNRIEWALEGLNGKELNRIVTRIGTLPLQIDSLQIRRTQKSYQMECRCHW